jgi:hypothetical protein
LGGVFLIVKKVMVDGCSACHKAGGKNRERTTTSMKADVRAKEELQSVSG